MNYVGAVHGLQGLDEACAEEFSLRLREPLLARQMKSEVTTEQKVHDQVKVLSVLKRVVRIYDEVGLQN